MIALHGVLQLPLGTPPGFTFFGRVGKTTEAGPDRIINKVNETGLGPQPPQLLEDNREESGCPALFPRGTVKSNEFQFLIAHGLPEIFRREEKSSDGHYVPEDLFGPFCLENHLSP